MDIISKEQVRQFRLHTHHLDKWYQKTDVHLIVGACGFQNSPPGAWEGAFYNRVQNCKLDDMEKLLEIDKTLLQAWSYRGAPVVFPTLESDTFLSSLVPKQDEPWIYTRGIQLALDYLHMPFDDLLLFLKQVMPKLDGEVLIGKNTLDQILSEWILPILPNDKIDLWNTSSMYGTTYKQTVGGAAISFLLRPCAFMGLVVFGKREGISPTFTSYKNWIGHSLEASDTPEQKLARKYLHCFAPATVSGFVDWLGCSPAQAKRIWKTIKDEIEPINLSGKECYMLTSDKKQILSPPQSERKAHLLAGHDPYLGLRDRDVILENIAMQKQIWQTVSNPGAVLWNGEIVGMWKAKKKSKALEIDVTLWNDTIIPKNDIQDLCDEYALFYNLQLRKIIFA